MRGGEWGVSGGITLEAGEAYFSCNVNIYPIMNIGSEGQVVFFSRQIKRGSSGRG